MASENKSKVSILTNGIIKESAGSLRHDGHLGNAFRNDLEAQPGAAAQDLTDRGHQHHGEGVADAHADAVQCGIHHIVLAGFVTIVQMVMHAYMDSLYTALGVFLPLIVVNCIILGRAEMFACKNNVVDSALDGVGMGLGYTLTATLMASIREILGRNTPRALYRLSM